MNRRVLSVIVFAVAALVAAIGQFTAPTASGQCDPVDCPPTKGTFAFTGQNKLRCTSPYATGPSTPGTGGGGCSFKWTEIPKGDDFPPGGFEKAWKISCVKAPGIDPCVGERWQNPVAGTCETPIPDPNIPPGAPNGYEGIHCISSGEPGSVAIQLVEVGCEGTEGIIGWQGGTNPGYHWLTQASCMCQGRPALPDDPTDTATVCNCKSCSGYSF